MFENMVKRKKKIIALVMIFALWFLMADAYWMSKKRSVEKCILEASTDLIKHTSGEWYFRDERWNSNGMEYYNAESMVRHHCSKTEGGGRNYWDEASGLAYWEILLTLPVIYRYRFD